MMTKQLFVSPHGDDTNIGSEDSPFRTLGKAALCARELIASGQSVEVVIRAGDYEMDAGLCLDERDSGTEDCPIVWRAYEGETVNLIGGVRADPSTVKHAENPIVINRLLDKEAAKRLMQIDLSGFDAAVPGLYSAKHQDIMDPLTVWIGEYPLKPARWPHYSAEQPFLHGIGHPEPNDDGSVTFRYGEDAAHRTALWSPDARKTLYLTGSLSAIWMSEAYDASGIDFADRSLTIRETISPETLGWMKDIEDPRFCFQNIQEEISEPYDSWLDPDTRILYFLPGLEFDTSDIRIATVPEPLISLNVTENISFIGLNFLYTRGYGIQADHVRNLTIRNCTVAHTVSGGMDLTGTRITVSGCRIYDTTRGGIRIRGGDRATLTSGESVIENCVIHDVSRDEMSYCHGDYGIFADSLGLIVRHNLMYNTTHVMVHIRTNDVVLEYNEFHHCATRLADLAAVYAGRDPCQMGCVIRYNYFHDIGNPFFSHTGQQAIFNDDGNNGLDIYGNLFVRATFDSAAIKTNGAQFSRIRSNLFVDVPSAYFNQHWGDGKTDMEQQLGWWAYIFGRMPGHEDHDIIENARKIRFDSEVWHKRYDGTMWGEVYKYFNENMISRVEKMSFEEAYAAALKYAPSRTNSLTGNVMVRVPGEKGVPYTGGAAECDNNFIGDESVFADYAGGDYTLTESALSKIRKQIPDFDAVRPDQVGPVA